MTRPSRRLTALYMQEPELILACLEGDSATHSAQLVLRAAQAAVQQCPDYADLLYYAARAALKANELSTAEELLARAMELNPRYRDALILGGRVAWLRGTPELALARLERAVAVGADYPDVHVLLGDIRRELGDWSGARLAYERALELNASLATARSGLDALARGRPDGVSHELPA